MDGRADRCVYIASVGATVKPDRVTRRLEEGRFSGEMLAIEI